MFRYILEIQRLEEERKSLKAERERLSENFEVKLRRAESLFEVFKLYLMKNNLNKF
jgi:hypothetical protein